MADLRYTVDVNTRDAVRSIDTLKGALVGLAAAFSFREIAQFADSMVNMRNKLTALTPDMNAVNQEFQALVAIANLSRTPLDATVKLFTRLKAAADETGVSTKEVAQVTETLGKILSMYGITGQEASGALLQLSQAIGSGVLRGEELNSVLEQMRPVAAAIAKEMGVPVGQLKKLAEQGSITSDIFFRAMRRIKDSIDQAFANTTPTIDQATTVLKNSSLAVFDAFDKTTGASSATANAIIYIAAQIYKLKENIDTVVNGLKIFLQVIGAIAAISLFGRALSLVGNILRALYTGFTEIVAAGKLVFDSVRALGAGTTVLAGRFSFLLDVARMLLAPLILLAEAFGKIAVGIAAFLGIDKLIEKLKSFNDSNSDASKEIEDFRKKLEGQKDGLDATTKASAIAAAEITALANQYAKLKLASDLEVDRLNRTLVQERDRLKLENKFTQLRIDGVGATEDALAVEQVRQRVAQDMYNATAAINDQIFTLTQEYNQLTNKDNQRAKELLNQIAVLKGQVQATKELYAEHEEGMADLITNQLNLKSIEDARKKINEDIVADIDRQLQKQEQAAEVLQNLTKEISQTRDQRPEFATLGFTSLEKELLKIQDESRRAAQRAAEQFSREFGEVTPLNESEFAAGLDAISQGYKELETLQAQFAKENYEVTRLFEYGWRDAFAKFAEDAANNAEYARSIFTTFTRGFEDAFVNFVRTGKLSFKDLANNILAEVTRMAANKLLLSILGMGSSGGGGFFASLGSLFGGFFADGGRLGPGKFGVVGENGPELITGPANVTPIGGGGATTVTYNIQAVDASSFRSLVARDPEFIFQVTEQGRRSLPIRSRR